MNVSELNYNHLHYFWQVARHGSVTRAAEQLHLAQPTLSSQIRKLERSLGERLFERVGRNLRLTESGQVVFRYAEEIFALGDELFDALAGGATDRPLRFAVGVADVLPKLITYRILQPLIALPEPVRLICHEGKLDDLLAELAAHRLDLVLCDAPVSPSSGVRAFNHPLGRCGTTFFATPELAKSYRKGFPGSLDGAPMLLPTGNTVLRRSLEQYFDTHQLRPDLRGEFEDSALLKTFGQAGRGIFPGPSAIEAEIRRQYDVRPIGRLAEVRQAFYAVSPERRIKHPAVVTIREQARGALFRPAPGGE